MSLFQLHATSVYSINSTIKKNEHKEKAAMLQYFDNNSGGRLRFWCGVLPL